MTLEAEKTTVKEILRKLLTQINIVLTLLARQLPLTIPRPPHPDLSQDTTRVHQYTSHTEFSRTMKLPFSDVTAETFDASV